jgi:hypothetical protein
MSAPSLLATSGLDGQCIGLYGNRHGAPTSQKAYLLSSPAQAPASALFGHDRGLSAAFYGDFRAPGWPN